MPGFGWDQPAETSGFFESGIATITKARFEEGQFSVQLILSLESPSVDGAEPQVRDVFYSMGNAKEGTRVVLDGGERLEGPNYSENSKVDCLLKAMAKTGAPALRGNTASAFVGYVFDWQTQKMGDILDRTMKIKQTDGSFLEPVGLFPSKFIKVEGRVEEDAIAKAITDVLSSGPQKWYRIALSVPEGPLRDAVAANKAVIDRLVAEGAVTENDGTYALA